MQASAAAATHHQYHPPITPSPPTSHVSHQKHAISPHRQYPPITSRHRASHPVSHPYSSSVVAAEHNASAAAGISAAVRNSTTQAISHLTSHCRRKLPPHRAHHSPKLRPGTSILQTPALHSRVAAYFCVFAAALACLHASFMLQPHPPPSHGNPIPPKPCHAALMIALPSTSTTPRIARSISLAARRACTHACELKIDERGGGG